jgi:arylsulfatase A-like enzyme
MNVIVIVCDTLRADVVEHTWEDTVYTPNLDALRASSAVFANAWGEGEPTIPMRRGFFTGIRSYPWRYQVDDRGSVPNLFGWHAIPTEHTSLPEYLVPRGVMTGLVSDVYHMFKPTMNFTRGFLSWDFIRGQESDALRTGPLSRLDMRRHLPDDLATPEKRPGMAQYLLNVLDRRSEEDYFAPRVFRSASRWLLDNADNRPFFLWVDSFTPHEHWDPPTHFADRYYKDDELRDFIYPQLVQNHRPLTEEEVRRTKALYYGYVTFVDKWAGHFLDVVDDLALWDDTAVFFVSDHGTQLMDKGKFGKSPEAMHPFNFRLNFWLRHPDRSLGGRTLDAFVQNTDVVPTALGLLGVQHDPLDGFDLMPLLRGQREGFRDEVITAWGPIACVRNRDWSLVRHTTDANAEPRLYHLTTDSSESRNVASDHPNVVAELTATLEALLGSELPVTYTHKPTGRHYVGVGQWLHANIAA